MKIRTNHEFPPIPDRRWDWSAIDEETYDPEGCNIIGRGPTEQAAITDLLELTDRGAPNEAR